MVFVGSKYANGVANQPARRYFLLTPQHQQTPTSRFFVLGSAQPNSATIAIQSVEIIKRSEHSVPRYMHLFSSKVLRKAFNPISETIAFNSAALSGVFAMQKLRV